jgi:hypothetical protein
MSVPFVTFASTPFLDNIAVFIRDLSTWLVAFILALAAVFIVLAAFVYLGAGGNEERVAKAHRMIGWAAIAVVVAILARAGINLLTTMLTRSGVGQ